MLKFESSTTCHTVEEGRAWYNPEAEDPANRPAFFMEIGASSERGLSVFVARRGNERPPEGTYEIANISDASPPYPGRFDIYEDAFSLIGHEIEGGPALYISGTLTVTRSEENLIAGDVQGTAVLAKSKEEIEFTGRFKAERRSTPWQSY